MACSIFRESNTFTPDQIWSSFEVQKFPGDSLATNIDSSTFLSRL